MKLSPAPSIYLECYSKANQSENTAITYPAECTFLETSVAKFDCDECRLTSALQLQRPGRSLTDDWQRGRSCHGQSSARSGTQDAPRSSLAMRPRREFVCDDLTHYAHQAARMLTGIKDLLRLTSTSACWPTRMASSPGREPSLLALELVSPSRSSP